MKEANKNLIFIIAIIILTAALIYFLPLTGYLKDKPDILSLNSRFTIVFIIFNIVFIGIAAGIHRLYSNDYSRIKNIWFFAIFGGITGGLLGERSFIMIIPYTILMLIYAFFYKKFPWWKVALTTYIAGMIVENIINRSPIQAPTLMWVAFFTYPYFITKIWENRKKIKILKIIKGLKLTILFSILLGALSAYISRNNISPPLIILGLALPFIITIIYRISKSF